MAPLPEAAATCVDASSTSVLQLLNVQRADRNVAVQLRRATCWAEHGKRKPLFSHFVAILGPFLGAALALSVCGAALSMYTISKLRHL